MSRLHLGIVGEVAEDIVSGRIPPGQMLPREVDLSARYGVSRGVARECLRALEERGLVAVTHGRGARVTPPSEWNALDPIVLAALVAAGTDDRPISDALECLSILEGEAAGLAAERAAGADVAEIAATLERLEVSQDVSGAADLAFSNAVLAAAGNPILERIVRSLQRALVAELQGVRQRRYRRGRIEHGRVLAAIAGGHPDDARAAMRDGVASAARPTGADLVATP